MPAILITARAFRRHAAAQMDELRRLGFEIVESPHWRIMRAEEYVAFLRQDGLGERVVGIVAGSDQVNGDVLDAMPNLKVIARWGIGYDSIDLDAATERGVYIANTPGKLSDAVADLAFAMMLASARQIVRADKLVRSGGWEELDGVSVWGKSVGIIGFGSTGQALAKRARGFQMTIRAVDPYPNADVAKRLGVEFTSLDTLLAESDYVSLHSDLNDSTRNVIDAAAFAKMKPSAFLINVSRGGLVDEMALVNALESGQIRGAAMDAHAVEPPDTNHPLYSRDDVIFTPHIGFSTVETIALVNETVMENLLNGVNGIPPQYVVNKGVLER